MEFTRGVALAALTLLATACTSARMSDSTTDRLFRDGRYREAADRLKDGLEHEGDGVDRLLYLLDLGLSLHAAGEYAESNKYLLEADKYAEIKDYTSISEEAATILTSENVKAYRGEDFENVLISAYLAMNYALMGDFENALVECKRVNRKLELMVTEGKRQYKQNAFARYLSGILYEASHEYNDAYVDYRHTRELEPEFRAVGLDLWRTAGRLRDREAQSDWTRTYGLQSADLEKAAHAVPHGGWGQIVVLYENGISPRKEPNPDFPRVPRFYPRYNPIRGARVQLDGVDQGATVVLHDIEDTAIENLNEKYTGIVAKRIAGIVAKEIVANELERRTKNQWVGLLARVFFHASDQADIRSWSLLPRDLQILRVDARPGDRVVRLVPEGGGWIKGDMAAWTRKVHVDADKTVFVDFRFTP